MNKLNLDVRTLGNPFISRSERLPDQSDYTVNIGDIVSLQHEGNLFKVSVTSYDTEKSLFLGKLQAAYSHLSVDKELYFEEENIFEIKKT